MEDSNQSNDVSGEEMEGKDDSDANDAVVEEKNDDAEHALLTVEEDMIDDKLGLNDDTNEVENHDATELSVDPNDDVECESIEEAMDVENADGIVVPSDNDSAESVDGENENQLGDTDRKSVSDNEEKSLDDNEEKSSDDEDNILDGNDAESIDDDKDESFDGNEDKLLDDEEESLVDKETKSLHDEEDLSANRETKSLHEEEKSSADRETKSLNDEEDSLADGETKSLNDEEESSDRKHKKSSDLVDSTLDKDEGNSNSSGAHDKSLVDKSMDEAGEKDQDNSTVPDEQEKSLETDIDKDHENSSDAQLSSTAMSPHDTSRASTISELPGSPMSDVSSNVSNTTPKNSKSKGTPSRHAGRGFTPKLCSPQMKEAVALPLKQGWKREIVVRNTNDDSIRKNCDIYYFSPTGKKLRSMVEIQKHLTTTGSDLSADNFTFSKHEVYEGPNEVVRQAGKSAGRHPQSPLVSVASRVSPKKKKKKNLQKIKAPTVINILPDNLHNEPETSGMKIMKKLGRPRKITKENMVGSEISKENVDEDISPQKSLIRVLNLIPKKPELSTNSSVFSGQLKKIITSENQPPSSNVLNLAKTTTISPTAGNTKETTTIIITSKPSPKIHIPVAKKHTGKRFHQDNSNLAGSKKICTERSRSNSPQVIARKTVYESSEPRLCGLDCPRLVGIPPSLHCDTCMCLFHPSCVGYEQGPNIKTFICKGCKSNGTEENGHAVSVRMIKSISPPETVKSGKDNSTAIVISPTDPPPASSPVLLTAQQKPAVIKVINTRLPVKKINTPIGQPPVVRKNTTTVTSSGLVRTSTPGGMIRTSTGGSLIRPIPTSLPLIRNIAPPRPPRPVLPAPQRLTFRATDPRTAVTGQLLTLPPSLAVKVNLSQSLQIRVLDQKLLVPPTCFLSTSAGIKVILPPGALPEEMVHPGGSKPLSLTFQEESDKSPQTLNLAALESLRPDEAVSSATTSQKDRKPVCHFKKLHVGYESLFFIFRHLKLIDLLRAGQTCKTWRHATQHLSLWTSVNLRDCLITDWEAAAQHFQRNLTHRLDMRGMKCCEASSDTWDQFTAVLEHFKSIRFLTFDKCPSSMLHTVADSLPNLELLSAELITETLEEPQMWSTNTTMDLGQFSQLKHLVELKLRGVCGIVLSPTQSCGGLSALAKLSNLKTLSLTTLTDIPGDEFNFIGELQNLQSLELGDCHLWTEETYVELAKLSTLTSLRLENGGQVPDLGLGMSLKHLTQLESLELIKYAMSKDLCDSLQCSPFLRTLSVWPQNKLDTAAMNSNVLDALKGMVFLKEMDWGILTRRVANTGDSDDRASPKTLELPFLAASNTDDIADPQIEYLEVNQLVERLCTSLSDTKIRVFKVPVS